MNNIIDSKNKEWWSLELDCKPDFDMAMRRIYAWYDGDMIDRPPIRFTSHNSEFNTISGNSGLVFKDLKDRWFDAEYQIKVYCDIKWYHNVQYNTTAQNIKYDLKGGRI